MVRKFGMLVILAALPARSIAAEPTRTAIACTGEAIQDFKSFNLPSKTIPLMRVYVIDTAEKAVSLISEGEAVPLCDKAKPACHADFLPAGIRIDFHDDSGSEKLIYNRAASTMGDQTETAVLVTTFEGHCQATDLPAAAK